MKRILLLELCLLFLATTFQGDRLTGWVQQTIPRPDVPIVDLQFLDTLTGFMVASKSTPDSAFIFKTTDGGNNWISVVKDKLILTSIHFPNRLTGYCVGLNIPNAVAIVLKTTNSGNNWNVVSTLTSNILDDVCFVNNDTGWVCDNSGLLGGLWRTTNGGLNWQMQMNASNGPSKVFFVNDTTGWAIGSANYGLYKTTNCGTNWALQTYISSLSDIFFVSKDTGWAVGGNTGLGHTINGGYTWDTVRNPGIPVESKLNFINNKLGWAGGGLNRILATKDGYNWGVQSTPIRTYTVNFVDSLHGWAGYSGVVHTTDGGGPIVNVNNQGTETPEGYVLYQNYPNPFNQSTIINLQTSIAGVIRLSIYDLSGREITTLINEKLKPGTYKKRFDAGKLSSGIYFYSLFADGQRIETKKMVLVK